MASNSNPSSSSSSAESTSEVIYEGFLFKRGGFFKRWQKRHFKLYRNGTLDRYRLPIELNPEPTASFNVIEFPTNNLLAGKKAVLKTKCWDSRRVSKRHFRARNLREHISWYNALKEAAVEGAVMITNWDEVVNPGPSGSNSNVTSSNFEFITVLGAGAYSRVYLGKLNDSDECYAIKELNKKVVVERKQVEHIKAESRVLFDCKHPFLTSMAFAFQTKNEIYFAMDYCIGGDLDYHLHKLGTQFDIKGITFYAAEIAHGLGHLHSLKIVYRDLKPENVLLDKEGHIKIADFGFCKENIDHKNKTKTFCGTSAYIAPEVLEKNKYGCAVDWWALGVLVYEMVYRRLPFFDKDNRKMYRLIRNSVPDILDVDSTTKDFLTRLLIKNPKKRLGGTKDFAELQAHPFFKGNIDWDKLYNRNLPPPFVPDVENADDTKYFDTRAMLQPDITPALPDSPILSALLKKHKDNDIAKNVEDKKPKPL